MNTQDPETRTGSSRVKTYAAAGVIGLIAVAGVALTIDELTASDPQVQPAPSSAPTATAPAKDSLCGLDTVKMKGTLSAAPAEVSWDLVGSVALPSTPSAGPGLTSKNGVRYCYARTPTGALMMATNIYAWSAVPTNKTVEIVEHQYAAGPGYDSALKLAEADSVRPAEKMAGGTVQIRGFNLAFYDGSAAQVNVLLQSRSGAYSQHALEIVWERNDWRLRTSPTGEAPNGTSVPDATGFVPFAGA